ncbi:MAG: tetratricopeptide repeat protein [Acidobacteriota bacterium]|nr:tetratricopeptide repeat protein [Acidobacteriota bacterium]
MEKSDENFLHKAEHLAEIERWREAVPLLIKVIAKNPQHFHANCLLSLCHYNLKDFQKGLEYAERAIAAEPEEEWGHRLRSVALTEQGRKKEALKSAEEAVRLEPSETSALQTLIYALLNCGKNKRAEEIALKMRDFFPEMEMTFFALGNVYLQNGNSYEAERCFREALRLNPNSADARNNLGVALLRHSQAAENSLFKPNNLSILNTVGEDEIQQHFTEAVKLEPTNEAAAENLKNQFSYYNVLYGLLVFIPFVLIAFFVVPVMTVLMTLLGVYGFLKLFFEVRRRRKQLAPELRMFLKTPPEKSLTYRFEEFSVFAKSIYKKTGNRTH